MPGYAATKAAINNATSSLCQALAGSGVTVNAVSAGLIRTAEVERWLTFSRNSRERIVANSSHRRARLVGCNVQRFVRRARSDVGITAAERG